MRISRKGGCCSRVSSREVRVSDSTGNKISRSSRPRVNPNVEVGSALSGQRPNRFQTLAVNRDLWFRTMRLSIALAVALWVLIFFVPLVPYMIKEACTTPFCPLAPVDGFYAGYNSLELQIFGWGASLDTSFSFEYVPPIMSIAPGEWLTAFGVWIFVLFPITLFIAGLLLPEEWHMISAGLSRLQRWRDK